MKEINDLENTPSTSAEIVGATTDTTTSTSSTSSASSAPSLEKGSYISVKSGTRWYSNSSGSGKSGTARAGTIKYVNTKGSHPYNIDGLGWVKKTDIVGYADGGVVDYTGYAKLHGTPSRPEYVLNTTQMSNLLTSLNRPQVTSNAGVSSNSTSNVYNINKIELPNVDNAQKFMSELKSLVNITKNQ